MIEDPEKTLARIRETLPLIAHDAEHLGLTPLVRSPEMKRATVDIESLRLRSDTVGVLRLTIGSAAVEGSIFQRRGAYDHYQVTNCLIEPGEVYELRQKRLAPVQVFTPETSPLSYFGDKRFFAVSIIGQTLEEGGELELVKPDSSSSE